MSYLVVEYSNNTVRVALLMGKARVALIKCVTVPNLELKSNIYGAQFAQFVREEQDLRIDNLVFGLTLAA